MRKFLLIITILLSAGSMTCAQQVAESSGTAVVDSSAAKKTTPALKGSLRCGCNLGWQDLAVINSADPQPRPFYRWFEVRVL